jgi:hypothetical protein
VRDLTRQAARDKDEGSGNVERGRRDAVLEDLSPLAEPCGRPGFDGPDGPATRRVRVPIAWLASRSAANAGPSPLVAALAAVIRDAMAKDGR